MGKREVTLIVKPTHECNLNCPYCYDKLNRETEAKNRMSLDTVQKIMQVFEGRLREWIWHGGEPLLMGLDFFYQANALIWRMDRDVKIAMQTNGTLITQKTIDMFRKYGITPSLSFDGIHNNKTRKNTGRLIQVIDLLEKNKMAYGVIMLINPHNVDDIIGEYEFFKRLRISVQMNTIFKARGNEGSVNMDYKKMAKEICKFFDHWIHDAMNPTDSLLCRYYVSLLLGGGGYCLCHNTMCNGRWYGVHPQGELTPCGRDWDAETSFGSVHDYNDCEEIKNHPHFVAFRRKTDQLLKYCQDSGCPFFYACFSGCPGINYSYDARMEKPEPNHCQATQEILSHVYETIKHIDIARDATKYNPHFMRILTDVGFRSIDFIKQGVTGTINHEG